MGDKDRADDRPDDEDVNRLLDALVNRRGKLTAYEDGVADALGWVLGDYDVPEGLSEPLYEIAQGARDEEFP